MKSVTIEDIEGKISKTEFFHYKKQITVCFLTLKSGFIVTGFSGTIDKENFSEETGEKYARENAIDRLWGMVAFQRVEDDYLFAIANGRLDI